jgi:hypothetical protein
MAGLNDIVSDKEVSAVSLPSWYTTAQQDVANQAKTAASAVPAFGNTPAAGVISDMMGPNNAFNQGQNALSTIASGAANPWMQDATGNTVGNPATAMGGLFNAQSDYLNQILPNIGAAPTAGAVGSGQFGSLRGMTAAQKARGDAFGDLAQKQMTAALQNQQTGVQAGTGLSTSGLNEAEAASKLTDLQQKYPFAGAISYGNIVNAMKVPETRTTQTEYSPLSMITALATAGSGGGGGGGSGGLDLSSLYEGAKDIYSDVSNWWSGSDSGTTTTGEADTSWDDVWGNS